MLETSFGLFFFLKKPKNVNGNKRYIYLRITVDGMSADIATKRIWDNTRWISQSGRASGSKEDAKSLNSYLDSFSNQVYDAKKRLLISSKSISAAILKSIVTGKSEENQGIMFYFALHNKNMKDLIGIDYAKGTYDRFDTSFRHTAEFIKWKYGSYDLPIADLDYEFVSEYYYWLKTVRKCNQNSTLKYIANFKKIVLECIKKKLLPGDPFIDFKKKQIKTLRTPLDKWELKVIQEKTFETTRLDNIRDVFLFSCYTGLSYIDVKNLKMNQIVMGQDGHLWIMSSRQKTKVATHIPLLPLAVSLIQKYNKHPKRINDSSALPIPTNQKTNEYLKEIQTLCNISKNLTFHLARHTFATTITLGNGVPIDTVSKMLGHSTISQTEHYALTLDNKISDDMKILRNKMVQK